MNCLDCNNLSISIRNRKKSYCKKCLFSHESDMLEIIEIDNKKLYKNYEIEESIQYLNRLGVVSYRLDLHGVLDTIDAKTKLSNKKTCVISYLKSTSDKRKMAYDNILSRIKSGQIDFGIMSFVGKRKYICVEEGSKAWINSHLLIDTVNNSYFIDDGKDHIQSTESLNIPKLKCILMENQKLEKIMKLK